MRKENKWKSTTKQTSSNVKLSIITDIDSEYGKEKCLGNQYIRLIDDFDLTCI
jgi:hypothetical protein